MFRTTLSFLLCLAAAAGAQAQEGLYGGVFVTRTTFSPENAGDANPLAIGVKLGTSINKNFAVEGRVGTGLSDDSIDGVNFKVKNLIGIYGKGILPLSDKASLYGLVGYTHGKLTADISGFSLGSDSEGDVSYGVGGDFAFTPTMSLNVEYARLFKGDGYKLDGLTLGLSFKF